MTLLQTHHLTVGRTILLASGSDEFINVSQGPPDATFTASIVYSQTQELPTLVSVTTGTAAFLSQSGHVGVRLCHFMCISFVVNFMPLCLFYVNWCVYLCHFMPLCVSRFSTLVVEMRSGTLDRLDRTNGSL